MIEPLLIFIGFILFLIWFPSLIAKYSKGNKDD